MKTIVVLCEGVDDQAFLYRLLKVMGFSRFSERVTSLPEPIGRIIKEEYKNRDIGEGNIEEIKLVIPTVMKGDNLFILIYDLGGNTRYERATYVVSTFKNAMANPLGPNDIDQLGFILITDADSVDIEEKVEKIRNEYSSVFTESCKLNHEGHYNEGDFLIGAYIIADQTRKGRLEGIILSMMKSAHEELLYEVESFIDRHESYFFRNSKRYKDKMMIGISGQLQKPGKTNSVIIRQSTLITDEMINQEPLSKELSSYLTKFISLV